MIPERLKPLLSRLKNPPLEEFDPYQAERHKQIAPTAIKLIEEGIDLHLTAKFQDDSKLEAFVLRAAMHILTPGKEERKTHWTEYINKKFDDIIYIDLIICSKHVCNDNKIKKQLIKVIEELEKLREIYLSKLKTPKKPNTIDMLINLFLEHLPGIEETFIDEQIRKMVSPFDITLKKGAVRIRKYRSKDEWYTWKGNYFTRQED